MIDSIKTWFQDRKTSSKLWEGVAILVASIGAISFISVAHYLAIAGILYGIWSIYRS